MSLGGNFATISAAISGGFRLSSLANGIAKLA